MVDTQDLYSLRKKLGLSQEKMADKLGISRNTISRWERGRFSPSAENLAALERLYAQVKESDERAEQPHDPPAPEAPAAPTAARPKHWPLVLMGVGVLCAVLFAVVALFLTLSTQKQADPPNNSVQNVQMEDLEGEEVDKSTVISPASLHP